MKRLLKKAAVSLVLLAVVTCGGCESGKAGEDVIAPMEGEEKRLVVYTSHKEEVYGPVVKEFEERTGIWVEIQDGGTIELLAEIERTAGECDCDVFFGGGVESYEAYRNCFEPYICKDYDKLQSRYESEDHLWTAFTELPIVLIYNNKLVDPRNAPRSWEELLSERWKGKIAFADPQKSGSSCTALATMIQVMGPNEDSVLARFADILDGEISEGSGTAVEEVVSGTKLAGITLEETARKQMARNADISIIYPADGTSAVPDGCAIVKDCKHEENAKKFVDFIVSKDVQTLAVEQMMRRSVRSDVRQELLPESVKIVDFDLGWASVHREDILRKWSLLVE